LVKSCRSPWEEKRRTVGILCGEFAKSREPSDLTEEQGSYNEYSQRFKLRRGRTVDLSQQGRWICTWISISGFRRLKSRNPCNRVREITKREVPKGRKDCVGHRNRAGWTGGALSTRKSNSIDHFGFRGVKSRNPLHQDSRNREVRSPDGVKGR
jgi:hypothetical protein